MRTGRYTCLSESRKYSLTCCAGVVFQRLQQALRLAAGAGGAAPWSGCQIHLCCQSHISESPYFCASVAAELQRPLQAVEAAQRVWPASLASVLLLIFQDRQVHDVVVDVSRRRCARPSCECKKHSHTWVKPHQTSSCCIKLPQIGASSISLIARKAGPA